MDIEQKAEMLTTAYIHSYNLALKEVKNPNLAAQIATAVIMVIDLNTPKQQAINPLELLLHRWRPQPRSGPGRKKVR